MTVTIRRATSNDRDVLVDLWQELYEFHLSLDPAERLAPGARAAVQVHFTELLAGAANCFLIAEDDGTVIGFISGGVRQLPPIMVEHSEGYIDNLVVTARYRRRRVGEQLFRAMVEWFREHGVTVMGLSVAASNPVSHAFWRRMGFQDHRIRMRGGLT